MDKFCEDCVHNEVCRYEAEPPHKGYCNDKDTIDDICPKKDLISRIILRNEFVKYIDVFDLAAWNKINDIIDDVPAVDISGNEYFPYRTAFFNGVEMAKAKFSPKQGDFECKNCDYRKFTQQFIDGVVDVMKKNRISSVEELVSKLKGEEYGRD